MYVHTGRAGTLFHRLMNVHVHVHTSTVALMVCGFPACSFYASTSAISFAFYVRCGPGFH